VVSALAFPLAARGEVFYGKNQGLARAFPAADRVERRTYVLTKAEGETLEAASNSELPSRLVTVYEGWQEGKLLGYAHIDVDHVRARKQALMILLTPEGRIAKLEVLAFHEDTQYMVPTQILDSLMGRSFGDEILIGVDVDAISGATLTLRSTTAAARRMLAYYEILLKEPPAASEEP
jgi:hypothetical protein